MNSRSSKKPFFSVIVISYNGEATIGFALDSLRAQTYSKSRYEIIVIDDGSTDSTAEIVASYTGVKLVGLNTNQGISAARNAGLQHAKGDVYVCFDDDCVADENLLKQLATGYESDDVIGVGSMIVAGENHGLIQQFIHENDMNIFARKQEHVAKSKFAKFIKYFRHFLAPQQLGKLKPQEVTELYGLSSSFNTEALRKIEGWSVDMSGIEDRDVSIRLHHAFPDKKMIIVPDAQIIHDRGHTLGDYLARPLRRGYVNFSFHKKYDLGLPLFFYPIVYTALLIGAAQYSKRIALLSAFMLPPVFYFWWPIKAVKKQEPQMALFSYIQLAEETMVLAGLVYGSLKYFAKNRESKRDAQ